MGNTYTVIGSEVISGDGVLRIDPPVPASVSFTAISGTPNPNRFTEVIYTQQVPVTVFVKEIRP